MGGIRFGVFDHIEHLPDVPLFRLYEDRLQQMEALDEAGFFAYHLAEHHTPAVHSMAPSQNVFLSAAAQRTKRLRFGPGVCCPCIIRFGSSRKCRCWIICPAAGSKSVSAAVACSRRIFGDRMAMTRPTVSVTMRHSHRCATVLRTTNSISTDSFINSTMSRCACGRCSARRLRSGIC